MHVYGSEDSFAKLVLSTFWWDQTQVSGHLYLLGHLALFRDLSIQELLNLKKWAK